MKQMVLSILGRTRSLWLWARGVAAAARLLRDPNRLDEVFALDRATPREVGEAIAKTVLAHPDGRRALEDRHRIAIDLARLREQPRGTFGRAVADFYDANGLTPAAIPSLDAVDDSSYVSAHLYETHDVWHVATGFGANVAEEVGLQAFYAAQLPGRLAPILVAGGLIQAALWVHDDFGARLAAVARGYRAGQRARPLFGVRWDEMWDLPTDEVRRRLGLLPEESTTERAIAEMAESAA